jgi:hypothetical protein
MPRLYTAPHVSATSYRIFTMHKQAYYCSYASSLQLASIRQVKTCCGPFSVSRLGLATQVYMISVSDGVR